MSIDVTENATTRRLSERVAEEIRVAMTRRRRSGAWLAHELGVSTAWVSYRLTGIVPIDLNDLERIAAVLGIKAAELFPRGDIETYPATPFIQRPRHRRASTRPRSGRPVGHSSGSTRPNGSRKVSRVA